MHKTHAGLRFLAQPGSLESHEARDPLGGLHFDLLFRLLRFRCLGKRHGQHTLLEVRLDLAGVDAFRQTEGAFERAEATLFEMIVLLLLFFTLPVSRP